MRHDRRSAMITDEFVVEKPSFVEIKLTGDNIILYDYLLEQRFVLSPIAYEMFLEFDGIKSIMYLVKTFWKFGVRVRCLSNCEI